MLLLLRLRAAHERRLAPLVLALASPHAGAIITVMIDAAGVTLPYGERRHIFHGMPSRLRRASAPATGSAVSAIYTGRRSFAGWSGALRRDRCAVIGELASASARPRRSGPGVSGGGGIEGDDFTLSPQCSRRFRPPLTSRLADSTSPLDGFTFSFLCCLRVCRRLPAGRRLVHCRPRLCRDRRRCRPLLMLYCSRNYYAALLGLGFMRAFASHWSAHASSSFRASMIVAAVASISATATGVEISRSVPTTPMPRRY